MHRPDARDTPDTLNQHPLDRVVTTRSEAGAAMRTALAQDGTRTVLVPSTLTNHTVSNNNNKSCMQCNNQFLCLPALKRNYTIFYAMLKLGLVHHIILLMM